VRLQSLFTRFFRDFRRNQQGNILVIFGAGIGLVAGVGALAIDMGNAYVLRGQLQRTADAAALAGVAQLPAETLAHTRALEFVELNMPSADHGTVVTNADVVPGNWDSGSRTFTAAGAPSNALQIIAKRSQDNGNPAPTFFGRIIGINSVDIEVSAVATSPDDAACLLVLDTTSAAALDINNRTFTTNGCSIHVNSNDPEGIEGRSMGELDAASTCVVGGYDSQPTYTPTPDMGCSVISDPMASLAAPAVGPCLETNYTMPSLGDTLDPGTYCGGITANNASLLTLTPGTYVIQDGPFTAAGNVTIEGDGVTIYLTGNTTTALELTGASSIDISAQTTGELAGVLVYADRNLDPSVVHSLAGGASSSYEGLVYAPSTTLSFVGNSSGTSSSSWASYIANKIESAGNGELVVNYVPGGSSVPLPVGLGNSKLVQ
jgi:hypothetical protein